MFLFLAAGARYEVSVYSESPEGSTKDAHNTCTVVVEFTVLK